MSNTTTAPRKISLARVRTGWYCWQDFSRGISAEVMKNELGMWDVTWDDYRNDNNGEITAQTLNDARAYLLHLAYA